MDPTRVNSAMLDGSSPILLIASGQSNMANHLPYAWTPPSNLLLWNWDGFANADTDIGTAFSPISGEMGTAFSLGAEIAKANADRMVYIVNISKGSQQIEKWLTGGGSPDMFLALDNNVRAALAVIGKPVDVVFAWWQGEGNVTYIQNNSLYLAKFAQLRDRLKATSWFPRQTAMLVYGVSPYVPATLGLASHFNGILAKAASQEPETISYVNTPSIPQSFWATETDPSVNYTHMTAEGYHMAGVLGFDTLCGRARHALGQGNSFTPQFGYHQGPNPAFFATHSGGVGPVIVGNYSGVSLNSNNHFDSVNGVFTAPIDGIYKIGYKLGNQNSDTLLQAILEFTSNFGTGDIVGSQITVTKANQTAAAEILLAMHANSFIRLKVTTGTFAGGGNQNCFWGHLIS